MTDPDGEDAVASDPARGLLGYAVWSLFADGRKPIGHEEDDAQPLVVARTLERPELAPSGGAELAAAAIGIVLFLVIWSLSGSYKDIYPGHQTKAFALASARIGYLLAPPALADKLETQAIKLERPCSGA